MLMLTRAVRTILRPKNARPAMAWSRSWTRVVARAEHGEIRAELGGRTIALGHIFATCPELVSDATSVVELAQACERTGRAHGHNSHARDQQRAAE